MEHTGAFHPAIRELFDDAAKAPEGAQKRRHNLIEDLFVKRKGVWTIDEQSPLFKHTVTRFEANKQEDGIHWEPYGMVAMKYLGGEEPLEIYLLVNF